MNIGQNVTMIGAEILVSGTDPTVYDDASIAVLTNGQYVVSWSAQEPEDSNTFWPELTGVYTAVYNADGTIAVPAFLTNIWGEDYQDSPSVAALSNGGFVVTWEAENFSSTGANDQDYTGINARVFNANGAAVSTADIEVNTAGIGPQTDQHVVGLAGGGFVVTWQTGYSFGVVDIKAQAFASDGTKIGSEFFAHSAVDISINQINNQSVQSQAQIHALANGGYVITWYHQNNDPNDTSVAGLRAQTFNADGTRSTTGYSSDVTIAPANGAYNDTALLTDGRIVWVDSNGLVSIGDTTVSGLTAGTTNGNAIFRSIASFDDGRFVVAWSDVDATGADSSGLAIHAQVINPDGSLAGDTFIVNSTTLNDQFRPIVETLANGEFIVTWTSEVTSGQALADVYSQKFQAPHLSQLQTVTTHDTTGIDLLWGDSLAVLPTGSITTFNDHGVDGLGGGHNLVITGEVLAFSSQGNVDAIRLSDSAGGVGDNEVYVSSTGLVQSFSGAGVRFGGGDNELRNAGEISGAIGVVGEAGYELIINSGSIFGGISLGGGNDRYKGQDGGFVDGVVAGGGGTDLLIGSSAEDELSGGNNADILRGRGGDDDLGGGKGADVIKGGQGDDTLSGGNGIDTLTGGRGHDELSGGGGADSFIFGRTSGNDTVTDFQNGTDTLDLTAFALANFAALAATGAVSGGSNATVIDLSMIGGDGSILLQGFDITDLNGADFAF